MARASSIAGTWKKKKKTPNAPLVSAWPKRHRRARPLHRKAAASLTGAFPTHCFLGQPPCSSSMVVMLCDDDHITTPAPSIKLEGECRAGGRVHTPSRAAPPVGRHQLHPQGSSTYLLRLLQALGLLKCGRASSCAGLSALRSQHCALNTSALPCTCCSPDRGVGPSFISEEPSTPPPPGGSGGGGGGCALRRVGYTRWHTRG